MIAWLKKLLGIAPLPAPPPEPVYAHWTPIPFSSDAACGLRDPERCASDPIGFLGMVWGCQSCRARARRAILHNIAMRR